MTQLVNACWASLMTYLGVIELDMAVWELKTRGFLNLSDSQSN